MLNNLVEKRRPLGMSRRRRRRFHVFLHLDSHVIQKQWRAYTQARQKMTDPVWGGWRMRQKISTIKAGSPSHMRRRS
jgi:hypothetical protein